MMMPANGTEGQAMGRTHNGLFWPVLRWLFIAAVLTGLSIDNGNLSKQLATCQDIQHMEGSN